MSFLEKRREKALTKSYNAASGFLAGLAALEKTEGLQFKFTVDRSGTSVLINTNIPEKPENFDARGEYKPGNVSATVDRYGTIKVYDGLRYDPSYGVGTAVPIDMTNIPVMGTGPATMKEAITYIKQRAQAHKLAR